MTFAVLHMLGKQPVAKDLFMSSERGIEILSLIKCRIFVGILFGPTHLLLFIEFIMFLISLGVVGDKKKVLRFECFKHIIEVKKKDKVFCHISGVCNGFSVY